MLCLFNKKFSINGKAVMIEQSHVRFKTTLDGSESRCASVVATGNTMNWWGVRTKSTIRQPFVFSPIVTTGNDLFHHFPRPASSCLLDSDDLSPAGIHAQPRAWDNQSRGISCHKRGARAKKGPFICELPASRRSA